VYGTPVPVVTATAQYCDANVNITQSGSFPGTVTYTINVTSGNLSTQTYTVSCSMEAGNNTYLLDLLVGGVHWWEFDKNKYSYERTMPYGTTVFPEVTGIPEDSRSEVTYEILEGGRIVKIMVTAINGDVTVYQFVFFVRGNNNAFAKMIYVDMEPLKDFDGYTLEYDYPLPAGYMGVPNVFVELEDLNATILENSFNPTTTPAHTKVVILSEDKNTQITYIINWIRSNSIYSNDNETVIHVYPNPCFDVIHFEVKEFEQGGFVEIYSIEGKKTGTHHLQAGINTMDISSLQKGIYFYKIFTENTMIVRGKFIKN